MCERPVSMISSTKSTDACRRCCPLGSGVEVRVFAILTITLTPFMLLLKASNKQLFAPVLSQSSTENPHFARKNFCKRVMEVASSLCSPTESQNRTTMVQAYQMFTCVRFVTFVHTLLLTPFRCLACKFFFWRFSTDTTVRACGRWIT